MARARLAGCIAGAFVMGLISAGGLRAQEIMIWHDKGEDGLRMIEQMAELYKKDHPGVTVKSLSMPTEQWFSRSIAALNTNTAPDILFNDNARIVQIQQSTGKLADLKLRRSRFRRPTRRSSRRATGPRRPSRSGSSRSRSSAP